MAATTRTKSWQRNLERKGGFFEDADWFPRLPLSPSPLCKSYRSCKTNRYDHQIDLRLPLAPRMRQELLLALPPLKGKHVCDLLSGSGQLSISIAAAYPTMASLTLVDGAQERLDKAVKQLQAVVSPTLALTTAAVRVLPEQIELGPSDGGKYDVIVSSLGMHVIVGHDSQGQQGLTDRYARLFKGLLLVLRPGGHLIFGDHVGNMGVGQHLEVLRHCGFVDVDVAWRERGFFVAGGRRPAARDSMHQNSSMHSPTQRHRASEAVSQEVQRPTLARL